MAHYTATLDTPNGTPIGYIPNFISLAAARSFNTVGSMTLAIHERHSPQTWAKDMQFKLFRGVPNGPSVLLGNTHWLVQKARWLWSSHTWEITATDAIGILDNPIVAYAPDTVYADKTYENGNQGYTDNLLRAYVRENLGSTALDTDRRNPLITVEDDLSLGPVAEKTASWQELLSTLTGIASDSEGLGTPLFFEMVPTANGGFLFVVKTDYLGSDRSAKVVFSPSFNNLTEVELEWDFTNAATAAYVGGVGDGAGRLVTQVEDATGLDRSPFARMERFVDMREEDRTTVLQEEGRAFLTKAQPKVVLNAKALDTPSLMFGRDYFYGDKVKATVGRFDFTPVISAFSVQYENGNENLDLRLKADTQLPTGTMLWEYGGNYG